jgi:hypothetical protein
MRLATATRSSAEYVATVNFRGGDWRVSAGAVVGPVAGFDSVDAAIAAARPVTDGVDVAAAGVFEVSGRFVLRALSSEYWFSTRPQDRGPAEAYTHLEQLYRMFGNDARFAELRVGADPTGATFPTSAALRAIVDGPALLHVPR